jgi:hypothetical protein
MSIFESAVDNVLLAFMFLVDIKRRLEERKRDREIKYLANPRFYFKNKFFFIGSSRFFP